MPGLIFVNKVSPTATGARRQFFNEPYFCKYGVADCHQRAASVLTSFIFVGRARFLSFLQCFLRGGLAWEGPCKDFRPGGVKLPAHGSQETSVMIFIIRPALWVREHRPGAAEWACRGNKEPYEEELGRVICIL